MEITNDYQGWTYFILFLIIFAETGFVVTPFLPGDSLLFATGALIAHGNSGLDIYLMALLLLIAAIAGNTVNYEMGRYFGSRVFKEDNKVLKLDYYLKTQAFFEKHGGKAVIFSRFLPIFRTIAPFVAGVGKMPLGRYTLYNFIGGFVWIILFLFLGFFFGNIPIIKQNFTIVIVIIIIVTALPAVFAALKSAFSAKNAQKG